MVTLHFKLSTLGSVQLDIAAPTTFTEVLEQCALISGIEIGAVIAVKDGQVVGLRDTVSSGDSIDIYPALSGG